MARVRGLGFAGAAALVLAAQPALADVKAGVDAWSRGDYALAVREWQGPAEAGDTDALFNLGQAYRLGRGVQADEARAETYYARAAAQGHVQAADTYGLMLFQSGRREEALPYVQGAAERGDPRSQYLLGIAHFNGDIVQKDWVRAYALLTLANSAGLPQATAALAQMDQHIPLAQRQQGAGLASQLRGAADAARGRELAAAELAIGPGNAVSGPEPAPTRPVPSASPRIPQPIATAQVSPSVAAARAAVAEASRVTGTEDPGVAGADFARPGASAAPPPVQVAVAAPPPVRIVSPPPVAAAPRPAPAPASGGSGGPWRLQLGAFGVPGNAEKLWARLASRPELSGKTRMLVPAGRVTKLQAGGFASQGAAEAACRTLKAAGQECIATTR